MKKWSHPGGKLRELGGEALSDAELLAILISMGVRGMPAEKIAEEVVERFGSLSEMANVPLERFLEIKGLSDVKIIRIAAAFAQTQRGPSAWLRTQPCVLTDRHRSERRKRGGGLLALSLPKGRSFVRELPLGYNWGQDRLRSGLSRSNEIGCLQW